MGKIQSLSWTSSNLITVSHAVLGPLERYVSGISSLMLPTQYALINTKSVGKIFDINCLEIALTGAGSNNQTNVYQMYAAKNDSDSYHHVAEITAVLGLQPKSATLQYADTISVTLSDNSFTAIPVQSGNDQRARLFCTTSGYSKFLFLVSSLSSTSAGVDVSYFPDFPAGLINNGVIAAIEALSSAATLINNAAYTLGVNSTAGGTVKLTVSSNAAVGPDVAVRSAMGAWTGTGPVTVQMDGNAADADDFPVIASGMPLPVRNLNELKFYSPVDGDFIYLIWRN